MFYNLFYNFINIPYRIKWFFKRIFLKYRPDISAFEPPPLSPEEEMEIDEAVNEMWERVPELNPACTALFNTPANDSIINCFNEPKFCRKIRRDCKLLLQIGYDVFVINRNNNYGFLAMQEMLRMKQEGFEFKLYCCGVYSEHNTLLNNTAIQKLYQMHVCDEYYRTLFPHEFINHVIRCVTVISTESSLFYSHKKIPKETYYYYRKLQS